MMPVSSSRPWARLGGAASPVLLVLVLVALASPGRAEEAQAPAAPASAPIKISPHAAAAARRAMSASQPHSPGLALTNHGRAHWSAATPDSP